MEVSTYARVAMLVLALVACALGDVTTDGATLTVTTPAVSAVFRDGDLVAISNPATGESYLQDAPGVSLLGMDLIRSTGQQLAASGWTVSD
jgi:hypothetical protein